MTIYEILVATCAALGWPAPTTAFSNEAGQGDIVPNSDTYADVWPMVRLESQQATPGDATEANTLLSLQMQGRISVAVPLEANAAGMTDAATFTLFGDRGLQRALGLFTGALYSRGLRFQPSPFFASSRGEKAVVECVMPLSHITGLSELTA